MATQGRRKSVPNQSGLFSWQSEDQLALSQALTDKLSEKIGAALMLLRKESASALLSSGNPPYGRKQLAAADELARPRFLKYIRDECGYCMSIDEKGGERSYSSIYSLWSAIFRIADVITNAYNTVGRNSTCAPVPSPTGGTPEAVELAYGTRGRIVDKVVPLMRSIVGRKPGEEPPAFREAGEIRAFTESNKHRLGECVTRQIDCLKKYAGEPFVKDSIELAPILEKLDRANKAISGAGFSGQVALRFLDNSDSWKLNHPSSVTAVSTLASCGCGALQIILEEIRTGFDVEYYGPAGVGSAKILATTDRRGLVHWLRDATISPQVPLNHLQTGFVMEWGFLAIWDPNSLTDGGYIAEGKPIATVGCRVGVAKDDDDSLRFYKKCGVLFVRLPAREVSIALSPEEALATALLAAAVASWMSELQCKGVNDALTRQAVSAAVPPLGQTELQQSISDGLGSLADRDKCYGESSGRHCYLVVKAWPQGERVGDDKVKKAASAMGQSVASCLATGFLQNPVPYRLNCGDNEDTFVVPAPPTSDKGCEATREELIRPFRAGPKLYFCHDSNQTQVGVGIWLVTFGDELLRRWIEKKGSEKTGDSVLNHIRAAGRHMQTLQSFRQKREAMNLPGSKFDMIRIAEKVLGDYGEDCFSVVKEASRVAQLAGDWENAVKYGLRQLQIDEESHSTHANLLLAYESGGNLVGVDGHLSRHWDRTQRIIQAKGSFQDPLEAAATLIGLQSCWLVNLKSAAAARLDSTQAGGLASLFSSALHQLAQSSSAENSFKEWSRELIRIASDIFSPVRYVSLLGASDDVHRRINVLYEQVYTSELCRAEATWRSSEAFLRTMIAADGVLQALARIGVRNNASERTSDNTAGV